MKKLFLVRHAKSSWQYDDIDDYDRPLKGRGIRDAHLISQWIGDQEDLPEYILSSPATRALHTALIFARNLNFPIGAIQLDDALYLATSEALTEVIRRIPDEVETAMIFSHNPTVTNFVNTCVDQRIDNVPTSGVVSLHFDITRWSDAPNRAELLYFDYPKKRKKSHS